MGDVSIIGLDLAKNVFQAHGAGADGSVVFRRKLSRAQLMKFMAAQPPCVVAMEAWSCRGLVPLLQNLVGCSPNTASNRCETPWC